MEKMRWIGVCLAVVTLAVMVGCSAKPQGPIGRTDGTGDRIIQEEPKQPEWVNSRGPWEEEWNKDHPQEADRYIWVVGTSQAVDSLDREQWAEKSAQDQAIEELINALGQTVNTVAMETEAWSDETRDLVIGAYKEAVKAQIADHKINFQNYQWYRYVVSTTGIGGLKKDSYLKKGLFRLDKMMLTQKVVDETVADVGKRIEKNTEVQKELVNRAKEQTRKAMQDLMGK